MLLVSSLAFLALQCEAFLELRLEIQCILGTLAFLRLAHMVGLVERSKLVVEPSIMAILEVVDIISVVERILELEQHISKPLELRSLEQHI